MLSRCEFANPCVCVCGYAFQHPTGIPESTEESRTHQQHIVSYIQELRKLEDQCVGYLRKWKNHKVFYLKTETILENKNTYEISEMETSAEPADPSGSEFESTTKTGVGFPSKEFGEPFKGGTKRPADVVQQLAADKVCDIIAGSSCGCSHHPVFAGAHQRPVFSLCKESCKKDVLCERKERCAPGRGFSCRFTGCPLVNCNHPAEQQSSGCR